jgi:30S ribosomal protein S31
MGKGDRKSTKGKRAMGSFGKTRARAKSSSTEAVAKKVKPAAASQPKAEKPAEKKAPAKKPAAKKAPAKKTTAEAKAEE